LNTPANTIRRCRHCDAPLEQTLVDLGSSPLCNTLLDVDSMNRGEAFYPLHVRVCGNCFLAQLDEFVSPDEIFGEYSYFSSFSDTFVAHARRFVEESIDRFRLNGASKVIEVASNDGYLLQHFRPHGVPVLGIEPARNVAEAAVAKGIPTVVMFLGEDSAREIVKEHGAADLVVANNVLAHTPHLNDFVAGLAVLAGEQGVVSVEFPHLVRLINLNQFDTIYHEHFSYYSFHTVCRIFESKGLRVFDVQEIDTHGGSLRVFATVGDHPETPNVQRMHAFEQDWGVTDLATYANFTHRVEETKRQLLECLIPLRRAGKHIVGYGVPGKGNTLLNYCGLRTDFIDYMVDRNPYKQGRFTPGTRIPIYAPERIRETQPDYVLIMIWNLVDEVVAQLDEVRSWGGKFIVPIPNVKLLD
jgi:hypothetical protein